MKELEKSRHIISIKLKWIIIIQVIIILILLSFIAGFYIKTAKIEKSITQGYLSPRIYSGIIEPKSFLIVSFAPLKANIQDYISKNKYNISVFVENLRNGAYMGINERAGFFPTSLNKLPIAIATMKNIDEGKISLDTKFDIKDIDRDSSWGELYNTREKELPVRIILEKLLKESDNTALRVLGRHLNFKDVQLLVDYYDIEINLLPQRESDSIFMSPKSMFNLFSSLYFSTVLEPDSSEYLLSLLAESKFDVHEIAGIPDDARVAQKFGANYIGINKYIHSCGIMYIDETRIFYCVMTKDLSPEKAAEAIGYIVHETYVYVKDTKEKLDAYREN